MRDTGTGIPAEELPRLFERFHRVENARGRTHEGSGIGLALVQELVKLHGGSIRAESVLGQGTTFADHASAREDSSPARTDHGRPPQLAASRKPEPAPTSKRRCAGFPANRAAIWTPAGYELSDRSTMLAAASPLGQRRCMSDRPAACSGRG